LRTLKRRALIRLVPGQTFECLHDRVREHVLESLSASRARAGHLALAVAASQARELDSEFLARHYHGAGRLADAAQHAELAGDRAFAALALDHAARSYALALSCRAGDEPRALRIKHADAIASTGRCSEAAPLYLAAAGSGDSDEAILLRTRAAQMHFQAGERALGGAVLAPLLRAMGLRPARHPLQLFVWVYARMQYVRLLVRLPWLRARLPSRSQRLHAEVSFRLSQTLHTIDSALVTQLVVHMLPVALRDASPDRRALALAHYAALSATLGMDTRARQDALLSEAAPLSERATARETAIWVLFLRGVVELNRGQFPESLRCLESAWRSLDEGFLESHWLRRELLVGQCSMLALIGGFRELARMESRLHELSRYHDNAWQEAHLRQQLCFLWLAQGKPERVRSELSAYRLAERAEDVLQSDAFVVWASVHHQLYVGDPRAARAELERRWQLLESAGYTRFEPWSTGFRFLRGTIALALLAAGGGEREARIVRSCRAQLRKTRIPFAVGARSLLAAGLSHASGQLTAAGEQYGSAADAFEACGMAGYGAAARLRQAQLDPSRRAFQRAQRWFVENDVADAEAWVRMYAPVRPGGIPGGRRADERG
ncbi:MAG TPA: hypothetical protein VJR89_00635, partial [Polyangiales bacterium]|nr:hypothetical protein [Polyangiales bacterium]